MKNFCGDSPHLPMIHVREGALWLPAGKELTSWLSFVVSNCKFVTFPLVSCVRRGT